MTTSVDVGSNPELATRLGEFSPSLFGDRFYRSWELVNRYALEWTVRLGHELGIATALSRPGTAADLVARLGFRPDFAPAVASVLRRLADMNEIETTGDSSATKYGLDGSLRLAELDALRTACLEADEANRAALDILDAAGSVYRDVATGQTSGRDALFGRGQIQLWLDYFDNANPTYAINNRLAATAAAHRFDDAQPLRILEVGGGAASGTEALLQRLEEAGRLARVDRYRFTEPSPFFRRRAERALGRHYPSVPMEFDGLDIDRPFGDQGVAAESFDLVYGVNVLHIADDLVSTLVEIRRSLLPGGWLIAGECIRPVPGVAVSTEFVFLLLESYREVELDPELRPQPGFLAPVHWRRALVKAGFEPVQVVPDHDSIHEIYPHFYAGVVCGRRPQS